MVTAITRGVAELDRMPADYVSLHRKLGERVSSGHSDGIDQVPNALVPGRHDNDDSPQEGVDAEVERCQRGP
ncbi:hypothetical protein GCM10027176_26840 [Actinoallomurus bryophytorum]